MWGLIGLVLNKVLGNKKKPDTSIVNDIDTKQQPTPSFAGQQFDANGNPIQQNAFGTFGNNMLSNLGEGQDVRSAFASSIINSFMK